MTEVSHPHLQVMPLRPICSSRSCGLVDESRFLFGLKEKDYSSFTSFLFFNPVNNVLALTFTCSLIFFLLETKCKLSVFLRIELSINKTDYAAKENVIKNNNFGEKFGNVILFLLM